MNTLPVSASQSNDDFWNTLSTFQHSSGRPPRPASVRLDGKDGCWYELNYSEAEKKQIKTPWKEGKAWNGVLLMVKWFVKDKYEEGSKVVRRSREFLDFQSPVTMLEIDFSQQDGTKELETYANYQTMKDAMDGLFAAATQLAVMHKKPMPNQKDFKLDLWASLYVYDFETDQVVNIKAKGLSRSAVFTYLNTWKKSVPEAISFSQVLTGFDMTEHTEPQTFYAIKLTSERVLNKDEQQKIRDVFMQLLGWMKSFEKDNETHVQENQPVPIPEEGEQEVRVEDIPF